MKTRVTVVATRTFEVECSDEKALRFFISTLKQSANPTTTVSSSGGGTPDEWHRARGGDLHVEVSEVNDGT